MTEPDFNSIDTVNDPGRLKAVNDRLLEANRELSEKRMELDQLTHYLYNILRHVNEGLIFVGLEGKMTTYNKAAERILNREGLFKSYWDVFPDEFFGFSVRKALENFDCPEALFITINGQELEIGTNLLRKGPPTNQGIILTIRDFTEIRRLQKEAQGTLNSIAQAIKTLPQRGQLMVDVKREGDKAIVAIGETTFTLKLPH